MALAGRNPMPRRNRFHHHARVVPSVLAWGGRGVDHRHEVWELLLVVEGDYRIAIGKPARRFAGGPGTVFVIPPDTVHRSRARLDGSVEIHVLQWSGTSPVDEGTCVQDHLGRLLLLCRWLEELPAENPREDRNHLLSVALDELRRLATEPPVADGPMEQLHRYIEVTHTSQLDAAHLAGRTGLSVRQLDRRFKACFGVTPMTHLQRVRVDHALRLLAGGRTTLAAAARQVGFASGSHLGRLVRRVRGR
jgi:AraC-like DNA-binding protein/quercetin dioxygenase-like cupin family protein